MSNDIERLLTTAADDTGRPLNTDVDELVIRGRRSVRRARIGTISTALLTTAAIAGGVVAWSSLRSEGVGPAGQSITLDPRTGRMVDTETGRTIVPAPPASPLSDAEVLRRCAKFDPIAAGHHVPNGKTADHAGPVDARWKVVVKSGDQSLLNAVFLAPDQSIVATCTMSGPAKAQSFARAATADVAAATRVRGPLTVNSALRLEAPGVKRVLLNVVGETDPREALVGTGGFLTLGNQGRNDKLIQLTRVRGYDAAGKKVYDQVPQPFAAAPRTVPSSVIVKIATPITPIVVLTKDPVTGKPFASAPPVSPLTDDQVTTRCRGVDDIYFKDADTGGTTTDSGVIKAAGPVTKDWQVALKTGTGDKLTAVLVSPDKKVYAWCHMLTATAKGAYDYTRGAVQADGRFRPSFDFGMVPEGVAQLVVDLPTGPTRALISHGFYIWGLTGGNSGLKTVRVRGFDARGKQVYNEQLQVDADFD